MYLSICYPNGNAKEKKGWGWFCAQRRPGHALGWLQHMYQDPANIPDMLIIVDDDTAVDIELANRQMTMVRDSQINSHSPYLCCWNVNARWVWNILQPGCHRGYDTTDFL